MTAKEYLSQLITMDNAINRKQQRLMTLRDVAMNTTPNYSGETVQHTRNKNPLENIMTKIIDIDRDVHQNIHQLFPNAFNTFGKNAFKLIHRHIKRPVRLRLYHIDNRFRLGQIQSAV